MAERFREKEREREGERESEPQPPFDPSVGSFGHLCVTITHFSYRFCIFETSATALCGTTGMLKIPTKLSFVRFKNCAHRWHHHHHHHHHHQQQQQLMGEDGENFWHHRCAKLCNSPTFNPEFSRLHGQRGVIAPKLGNCNRLGRMSDSKTCQAILLREACDRWIFNL